MTIKHPGRLLAVLLPLALVACGEPEDTRPGQPVAHRRQAFHDILKAFEPIGKALKKDAYPADDIARMAKRLNEVKDGPWNYYLPDTNYPPSRSNDKVWSEPEKFAAQRQDFLKATEQLADAANARDEAKVRSTYEKLHQVCRDCHREFRK
jgi:cytochrome c556